jgi:hypothetical protein
MIAQRTNKMVTQARRASGWHQKLGRALRSVGLMILIALAMPGCATIMSGTRQRVDVLSDPPGASVILDGREVATTPSFLSLWRGRDYLLRFEKFGYQPVAAEVHQTANMWIFANMLTFSIPGIIVDCATGAASELSPSAVYVTLRKQ